MFPVGTRVFFWNGNGATVYGTIQQVQRAADGTTIVNIKTDAGAQISLPFTERSEQAKVLSFPPRRAKLQAQESLAREVRGFLQLLWHQPQWHRTFSGENLYDEPFNWLIAPPALGSGKSLMENQATIMMTFKSAAARK
ncbi:hypothetical protein B0H12DRAFT_1069494 [Mycena haematopus]|nr:hypothetical protein B0H12DRAFT_1069494 [Mycena haematopus]